MLRPEKELKLSDTSLRKEVTSLSREVNPGIRRRTTCQERKQGPGHPAKATDSPAEPSSPHQHKHTHTQTHTDAHTQTHRHTQTDT